MLLRGTFLAGPFMLIPWPVASQNLQPVSGTGQVSTGQAFQPVTVRVTDSFTPPNSVIAASVAFLTTVLRPAGNPFAGAGGETNPTNPAMPVILQVSQSSALTDINGLASIVPSAGGFSAPLEVDVAVTAGTGALLDYPLELLPSSGSGSTGTTAPANGTLPLHTVRPVTIERNAPRQPRAEDTSPW